MGLFFFWVGSWVLDVSAEAVSHSPKKQWVFAWLGAYLIERVTPDGQQSRIAHDLRISCCLWGETNVTPEKGTHQEEGPDT